MTNLSDNFSQICFGNSLSYIVIDYKKETFKILAYRLSQDEWHTLRDIMLYSSWLNTGLEYEKRRKENANVTNMLQISKTLDKRKKIV